MKNYYLITRINTFVRTLTSLMSKKINKCLLEAILPINKNILIYSIFYSL